MFPAPTTPICDNFSICFCFGQEGFGFQRSNLFKIASLPPKQAIAKRRPHGRKSAMLNNVHPQAHSRTTTASELNPPRWRQNAVYNQIVRFHRDGFDNLFVKGNATPSAETFASTSLNPAASTIAASAR